MTLRNTLQTLEQIYHYLTERPHFHRYSQYERLNAFFAEIHDTGSIECEAGQSYLFKGIFNGKPKVIDGSKAPALAHKQEFLSWVQQQL